MFNLTVETKSGQRITLTHRETDFQVLKVDGLNPPKALITSNTVVGMDGARFSSSKLEPRNIVITIKINGNVERNRLELYKYFKTKHYCKIYYSHGSRSIYAEGYVETIECDIFENGQTMQISIICHDPYLKGIDEIVYDMSKVIGAFEFPFAFGGNGVISPTTTDDAIEFSTYASENFVNVINSGDVDSGFIIEFTAYGTVVDPVVYCVDDNRSFGVNCTMTEGDVLIIDTISGEKSVTLVRDGERINYLKHIKKNSKWLVVRQGDNQYTYSATSGADLVNMIVKFRTNYEAV